MNLVLMGRLTDYIKSIFSLTFAWVAKLWEKFIADWHIYLEPSVSESELRSSREAASIPSFGFFLLLISATVIASLGLFANSTAVIIGAMIVAPLMNPILSMSFAIVTADIKLYRRSFFTVALGVLATIFVAYLVGYFVDFDVIGPEILARSRPNIIDLGVAVAAGTAGSFSLTRKSIASSIAGVAIAVALVPPLCVVGIGIALGNDLTTDFGVIAISSIKVSGGAFLLFLANLSGIIISASIVFLSQSYGGLVKASLSIVWWLIVVAALCIPLGLSFNELAIQKIVAVEIKEFRAENPTTTQRSLVRHVAVNIQGSTANVTILLLTPEGLITDRQLNEGEQRIFDAIQKRGMEELNIELVRYSNSSLGV